MKSHQNLIVAIIISLVFTGSILAFLFVPSTTYTKEKSYSTGTSKASYHITETEFFFTEEDYYFVTRENVFFTRVYKVPSEVNNFKLYIQDGKARKCTGLNSYKLTGTILGWTEGQGVTYTLNAYDVQYIRRVQTDIEYLAYK